ncbi:MAG: N-acetylmuramoyl-L-alanine amidase [Defluviitaleaceae bacterium]|nr:N-acetylmuramoyl-L-alanine amidase [Defluviitaleaceae bacterium]
MKKVFIDAGHNHSGFNTGAVANGMREQDITFDVAFLLGEILGRHGIDVRLSRPTQQTNLGIDNASAINARWQAANAWGADYFISIHANAGGGTGAETLFFRDDARGFAQTVQDVYSDVMGLRNRRIWRRDDIGVVRWARMPAILIELAFIDAPISAPDVEILRNRREDMAAAVAKGVLAYFGIAFQEGDNVITDDVPDWAVETIRMLVEKGYLKGDGQGLNLSMDMIRVLVILDRAGVFDGK